MTDMKKIVAIYHDQIWDEAPQSEIKDFFEGEFDFDHLINDHLVESFKDCMEIPTHLENYIDDDAIARDMRYDYTVCESDGKFYLFRDH